MPLSILPEQMGPQRSAEASQCGSGVMMIEVGPDLLLRIPGMSVRETQRPRRWHRVLPQHLLRPCAETSDPAAHVRRPRGEIYPDAIARADHALSNTRINCARPEADRPSIPRNRRPLASTISTVTVN